MPWLSHLHDEDKNEGVNTKLGNPCNELFLSAGYHYTQMLEPDCVRTERMVWLMVLVLDSQTAQHGL